MTSSSWSGLSSSVSSLLSFSVVVVVVVVVVVLVVGAEVVDVKYSIFSFKYSFILSVSGGCTPIFAVWSKSFKTVSNSCFATLTFFLSILSPTARTQSNRLVNVLKAAY